MDIDIVGNEDETRYLYFYNFKNTQGKYYKTVIQLHFPQLIIWYGKSILTHYPHEKK